MLLAESKHDSAFTHIEVLYTQYPGHAKIISKESAEKGFDIIAAVGGDGTTNEVLNGILNSSNPDTCLAVIPNGTGNDFCRGQKMVFTSEKFLLAIKNDSIKRYDVGVLENNGLKTYFLNVADIGFGGHTVGLLNKKRNILGGNIAYTMAILKTFLYFKKPIINLKSDHFEYHGPMMMLAVCNSSTFASGLIIQPDAKPNDGLLHLTFIGDVTAWDYISNILNLKRGYKIKHSAISYHSTSKVDIKIDSGVAEIEVDGEYAGSGNAVFSVLNNKSRLLLY